MKEYKENKTRKKGWTKATWLIALCWLVYACSYIGKLSYSANIAEIEKHYQVSYKKAGTVTTFFFFAYGVGQIVNGFFCKRYNLKYFIFGSLLISGTANVIVGLLPSFWIIKFVWLLNGVALSVLWPSLIRLLGENLEKKDIARAIVVMGTTVATGTFLVYGMSSGFVALGVFRITFFVAAGLLPIIAIVWLFAFPRLVSRNGKEIEGEPQQEKTEGVPSLAKEGKSRGGLAVFFAVCALFAVVNNLVKDGLTTWTPDILDSLYGLPGWTSILLTLLLPLLAIFGTVVATAIHKKIESFILICVILFSVSGGLVGVVIGFLQTDVFVVTVASFAVVSCLMAGVNNVITSMIPLYVKGKGNSGKIAGVLNGFCYLGSTLSSYTLGSIADKNGWNAVFYVLLSCLVAAVVIGCVYMILSGIKKKR